MPALLRLSLLRAAACVLSATAFVACKPELRIAIPEPEPEPEPEPKRIWFDADTSGDDDDSTSPDDDDSQDPPGDPCAGLAICDGFESSSVGAQPDSSLWSIETPNCSGDGAIVVTDVAAHSGTRAIAITGSGGYCNHLPYSICRF